MRWSAIQRYLGPWEDFKAYRGGLSRFTGCGEGVLRIRRQTYRAGRIQMLEQGPRGSKVDGNIPQRCKKEKTMSKAVGSPSVWEAYRGDILPGSPA